MRSSLRTLAVATALAVSAPTLFAGQPFGRDSVYANPEQAARQARVAAGTAFEPRLGRASVYATASSPAPAAAIGNLAGLQRHGRASVYAVPLDAEPVEVGTARVSGSPSGRATN